MKKEYKAYVTLYLSLTLGVMLTLVFLLLEAVRIETMKLETEVVMDTGLYSVFGEYHRQLLEQYDLFFVDTSYGQGKPSVKRCEERLQYYMNENFHKNSQNNSWFLQDLTKLNCDNVVIENYSYASDKEGKILKSQIVDYMQNKMGMEGVQTMLSEFGAVENAGYLSMDISGQWDAAEENLNNLVEEKKEELSKENPEEEISLDLHNPASQVKDVKEQGILGLALPTGKSVSAMEIHPEYYLSHRKATQGKGQLVQEETLLDKVTESYLFMEYLMDKCSSYYNSKQKAVLKYQMEYLLHGKAGDLENLESVMEDILHLREAINFVYLLSDSEKMAEADSLATLVSLLLFSPEIKEAVKITIVFAWTYAESVQDVRILMDGNKLPILKKNDTWNTQLSELLTFTGSLGKYNVPREGVTYEDYLRFFLSMKTEKELLYRFMDICEMDIRTTEGNQYFQMDGCINAIKATANISSGYGNGYEISRTYCYE